MSTGARCSGHCCRRFTLLYSPEELAIFRQRTADGEATCEDIEIIEPMVIYLGKHNYDPQLGTPVDAPMHHYTCKNFDEASGDCRIYETRPGMCRNFPYDGSCRFRGCTSEFASCKAQT